MRIKLRPTDKLFSSFIRQRDNFTCQKCGQVYVIDGVEVRSLRNLGVSHYYGRGRENTRFDPENCDLLCNLPCHRKWEGEDRAEYTEFKIKKLGQEGFNLLTLRANTYKKRDDKMIEIILKEMLKELEGGKEFVE